MITDIAYAEPVGRAHLLDLYLPGGGGDRRPLIIWTGGSAWLADNGKDSAGPIAEVFNPLGYAVAGVSIRSSTQATFPAQLDDIRSAIRWLRANAGTYGVDPDRIAIMGDSSGGWTTVMAALNCGSRSVAEGGDCSSRSVAEGGDCSSRSVAERGDEDGVRVAVAFYPPTDFRRMNNDPLSPESRLLGGTGQDRPDEAAAANPATYARRHSPPIMLLHGGNDPLVPHEQSVLLYEALKAAGATATFYSVPAAGHDWRAVLDPSHQDGTTVRTTEGGREHVARTPPTWAAIEAFIRRAFG